MARAHSIWVPLGHSGSPLAAFTVKHEMVEWLITNYGRVQTVYRLNDGDHNDAYVFLPREFFPKP